MIPFKKSKKEDDGIYSSNDRTDLDFVIGLSVFGLVGAITMVLGELVEIKKQDQIGIITSEARANSSNPYFNSNTYFVNVKTIDDMYTIGLKSISEENISKLEKELTIGDTIHFPTEGFFSEKYFSNNNIGTINVEKIIKNK